MKKLILSLFFLSAFTLRGSAQLQGLEVVKVPEAQQPYSGEYIYIPDVEGPEFKQTMQQCRIHC